MEPRVPLRYKITSWSQLVKCQSNNSRDLSISVTDFIQSDILVGRRIQVNHISLGVLFSYLVECSGSLITSASSVSVEGLTTDQILNELSKFGFLVEYDPASNLSEEMIKYLNTLKGLNYDKIRIISVESSDRFHNKSCEKHIVAFQANKLPSWLGNTYVASTGEFQDALYRGYACNLTNVSETHRFSWSWLNGWVANIQDILDQNDEVI